MKSKVDHIFHTLESKGYECLFRDNLSITVRTPKGISEIYLNDAGDSADTFRKNTAKHLAHRHGLRYNEVTANADNKRK